MPYSDCVLTVDGVDYDVSLGLLAHRSEWFENLLSDSTGRHELSKNVQTAWDEVRALAGNPLNLSFATFYQAMETGRADISLFHCTPTCPDVVMGYFLTRHVSYGFVLVRIIPIDYHSHNHEIWFAVSATRISQDQIDWLMSLKHHQAPGRSFLSGVCVTDWMAVLRSQILDDYACKIGVPHLETGEVRTTAEQWAKFAQEHHVLREITIPLLPPY